MIDFSKIPLIALSEQTKQLISTLLNPPKVIPTENNLLRDWRGLANEMCIGGENLPLLANSTDPTRYIISHMEKQPKCMFIDLQQVLEKIDRWDILSDAEQLFENDAKEYLKNKEHFSTRAENMHSGVDSQILTVDDLYRIKDGMENMHYDAFLLYAEEDNDFAHQVVDFLEKKSGLKLCIKDRNLIPGLTFTHDAIIQLISERCNRLLVILSPSFLVSKENTFFLSYAQAIGIDKGQRKIVPCMYKRCELPLQLRYMYILDYNRAGFYDFWGKLRDSIQITQARGIPMAITSRTIHHNTENVHISQSVAKLEPNIEIITSDVNLRQAESHIPDQHVPLSLPSVSHLDDPGDSEVKQKLNKKKYISVYKKKLQSLILRP